MIVINEMCTAWAAENNIGFTEGGQFMRCPVASLFALESSARTGDVDWRRLVATDISQMGSVCCMIVIKFRISSRLSPLVLCPRWFEADHTVGLLLWCLMESRSSALQTTYTIGRMSESFANRMDVHGYLQLILLGRRLCSSCETISNVRVTIAVARLLFVSRLGSKADRRGKAFSTSEEVSTVVFCKNSYSSI